MARSATNLLHGTNFLANVQVAAIVFSICVDFDVPASILQRRKNNLERISMSSRKPFSPS